MTFGLGDMAVGEVVGKNGNVVPVIQVTPPQGVKSFFILVTLPEPLPSVEPKPGTLVLDVAYPQEVVDWQTLHDVAKATHVVIRTSQGLAYDDVQFAANWPGAKAVGMVRSAYHLLETERNGQKVGMAQQANKMYSFVANDPPEWFYAMDYEPAIIKQPHASEADIELFHSTLKALVGDARRWNYTSQGMWAGYTRDEETWGADYTPPLNEIKGLRTPSMWQFGVAKVPGIKGWVDVSMYTKGMTNPVPPLWAYKRTGENENRVMYYARAKNPTADIEFYDKPEGRIHTHRPVPYKMGVFRVTLDGKWACVVDGGSVDWWCSMERLEVL